MLFSGLRACGRERMISSALGTACCRDGAEAGVELNISEGTGQGGCPDPVARSRFPHAVNNLRITYQPASEAGILPMQPDQIIILIRQLSQ